MYQVKTLVNNSQATVEKIAPTTAARFFTLRFQGEFAVNSPPGASADPACGLRF
jgi:hypothetical protein